MSPKKRLGRGLDALLTKPAVAVSRPDSAQADKDGLKNLPLEHLQRGHYQPRVDMRQDSLEELADSIKAQGVIQPIVARPISTRNATQRYEIVAGERRWRAAQMAFDPSASANMLLAGLLTLLITTATLLYLYVDPHQYLAQQPGYVRRLMSGWIWLGQKSIWLAAGLIFARLMAARLSLLIVRMQFFVNSVYESRAWQWVESWVQSLSS